MQSPRNLISLSLPLAGLCLASACGKPGSIAPPANDLLAVVEAKPIPTAEIATSQLAADLHSAEIESWGDRISAAGGRLCRWTERTHKVKLDCPK